MRCLICVLVSVLLPPFCPAADLRQDAGKALRRAVAFFSTEVAHEGTYLWQYSEDLAKREGEGVATTTQGWVQPPGTPAVGLGYLSAWEATGDPAVLQAVKETAHGLVRGQLQSGGWTYVIDLSPEGMRRFAYRAGGNDDGRNVSTLDDDTTQSALRFLMRADRELKFADDTLRDAVALGLNALLHAQYPNGAWPQGWSGPPDLDRFPVVPATFPEDWPRTWPGSQEYWFRYTLNDNALATAVETVLLAEENYSTPAAGEEFNRLAERCGTAARKAGDFLILAQMPEPQPAWAQQYDFEMHPSWARKFEPPAVSGAESQTVLQTLMTLFRRTGDARFLEPIPRALDYLQRSRLADGRLARFYELRSNRPLYFTREYELTYDDGDIPSHYSFKVADRTTALAREFQELKELNPDQLRPATSPLRPAVTATLEAAVREIVAAQDERGRWIEDGGMRFHRPKDPSVRVINTATFNENIQALASYLKATRP